MALLIKGKDIKDGEQIFDVQGGRMSTKFVFGELCNMMVATRAGGYHSFPHTHDAEQVNYVADGEVWVFMENKGFLAQTGDFFRIPKNAVHWAWNRSDKPCTIVETHCPPVEPNKRKNSVGLFDETESPTTEGSVPLEMVEIDYKTIERRILKEAGVEVD